jgi:hypothetical protein
MDLRDYKVVIAPGAFDDVHEEDQKDLMDAINAAIADGSFFTDSKPVDLEELEREEPEVYAKFVAQVEAMPIESDGEPPTVH